MIRRLLPWAAAAALLPAARPAETADYFAPWHAAAPALAPDGRHLAYLRDPDALESSVVIVDCDHPEHHRIVTLPAALPSTVRYAWADVSGRARLYSERAEEPRLWWLGSARLVVATAAEQLVAVDAATGDTTRLGDPRAVAVLPAPNARRPIPRPFLPVGSPSPDLLWAEAQGALAPPGPGIADLPTELFAIDVTTGQRTSLGARNLAGTAIYDDSGHARILHTFPTGAKQDFLWSADLLQPGKPAALAGLFPAADRALLRVGPGNYLGRRIIPLAVDGGVIYYASNGGRDTYGIYALDSANGTRTPLAIEDPAADAVPPDADTRPSPLVFDRARHRLVGIRLPNSDPPTHWLDPELAGLQTEIEAKLPGRRITLLDWDDRRQVILVSADGPDEPGRYFLYRRSELVAYEVARRAPGLRRDELGTVTGFFLRLGGQSLRGRITQPRNGGPHLPVALLCRTGPFTFSDNGFDREAHALAAAGFAVIELEYPGTGGRGLARRTAALDESAQAVAAAVAAAQKVFHLSTAKAAVIGFGFGGWVGLRATELHPELFRCVACVDAPLDLVRWTDPEDAGRRAAAAATAPKSGKGGKGGGKGGKGGASEMPNSRRPAAYDFLADVRRHWLEPESRQLAALSPARHPEKIAVPLLLAASSRGEISEEPARALAESLTRAGRPPRVVNLLEPYDSADPDARAAVFASIVAFVKGTP